MAIVKATAAAVYPVSLFEVKQQARVDVDDDDLMIQDFIIPTATGLVEETMRRALVNTTYRMTLDTWPGSTVCFPYPPLVSITSVNYYDESDNETTYSSANYYVDTDSQPGRLVLKTGSSWPSGTLRVANGVQITFVAGYGATAESVPDMARQTILILAATLYEHREDVIAQPGIVVAQMNFVRDILQPLRSWTF